MIISKRSQLNKLEKERPLLPLIDDICSVDQSKLAQKLQENMKWEKPSGDLLHWIRVLNLFDDIFERQIAKYGLDQDFPKLRVISPEDKSLLVACLQFSGMLLDHCNNRNIYSSLERIYQLMDTPTVEVKLAAFEVAWFLGERFVQLSMSKRYAVPKSVRLKALDVAKLFPPPIPTSFMQKQQELKCEDPEKSGHYSLVDLLDFKKRHPSKWKLLTFQYYVAPKTEKKDKKKEKKEEGLATFHLNEEQVRKMSLEQIFDRANEVLPKETLLNFSLAALSAKAFNTKLFELMKFRAKLLQIKCWAISFVCSVCSTDFTSLHLYEPEPYTFSFLVDLISPEHANLVTNDIFYAAVKTLECISMRRVWGTELIRHLGGNVSHGLLYQVLRHINKKIRNEDEDCFEKGYLVFFTLLGNFVDSKQLTPRLASGGLLNDLMAFVNVHTKYRWTCSAALNTIAIFLTASPELISEFANNDGFQLLIDCINYEVQFALDNPDFGGGPPKDIVVHYSITLRQVNFLRNLLKLVSHLIQSDAGDRLRNLFDSSILSSFNKIMENPSVFGPFVLSSTLDAVMYIVHNEPTAFSILKEAHVIETILTNYGNLFMPSSELLISLLEILGAISLNKEGLRQVTDSGALKIYFQSFYKVEYAKELMRADMSTSIGCSMDELGRHYPTLRPVIMAELKSLIDTFPEFANAKLTPIQFYTSEKHGNFYHHETEDIIAQEEGHDDIDTWEGTELSNLVDNVISFLSGLLQDSGQWGKDCVQSINFRSFEKFVTFSNAPFDYTTTNGIMNLMSILKYLDDEDRDYAFPKILESLSNQMKTEAVENFSNDESGQSYFQYFDDNVEKANEHLKSLNVLNSLLYTITEIYLNPSIMFNERYLLFMNFFEQNSDLIGRLVKLLRRSIAEEIFIRSDLPDAVIANTAPVLELTVDSPPLQVFANDSTLDKSQEVHNSAKYKNTLQFRFLAYRFQYNATLILTCISRSCMQRRQDYFTDAWRRNAVTATRTLAEHLQELWQYRNTLMPSVVVNYELVAVDVIKFIATSKDKGKEVLSASLVLYFFHTTNLVEMIVNETLDVFNQVLELERPVEDKTEKPNQVKNNRYSISVNYLRVSLAFLLRFLTHGFVTKLPFSFLFYNKEYCPEDLMVVDGIVSQAAGQIMGLLVATLGSKLKLIAGDYSLFEHIPPNIAEKLVYLVRQVWAVEPVNDFYPLNPMWMSPAYDQVQYLVENADVSRKSAEKLIDVAKSLRTIRNLSLENIQEDPEWQKCADLLEPLDFSPEMPRDPIHTNMKERIERAKEEETSKLFSSTLIKFCAYTKDLQASVAQALKDNGLDEQVYQTIETEIDALFEDGIKEKFTKMARLTSLLEILVCHDPFVSPSKIHTEKQIAFNKFTTGFLEKVQLEPSCKESKFFVAGLSFIEPIVSQTKPVLLDEIKPYFPDLELGASHKDQLLSVILDYDPQGNTMAAVTVCRLLYLFGKDEKYKSQVASSPVLKRITKQMTQYISEGNQKFKILQNLLILVHRVCFENKSNNENVISSEITKILMKLPSHKKDLLHVLEYTKSLIGRDPALYIEVATKMLRIENYNSATGKIVFLLPPKDRNSEDLDTTSPENGFTTGLVHMLLSQLMELSKSDWVSVTEDEKVKKEEDPKKKKDTQFETLLKNPVFGHMCFLLQTITELLGSYKGAKLEFITFSKKLAVEDKNKPRSTSLNFFIHQLIPSQLFVDFASPEYQRRETISSLAKLALLALVSTPILANDEEPDPKREDADMAIVRKFVVSIISKILKETSGTKVNSEASYSKIYDLFDLCGCLLSTKFRELCYPLLSKNAIKQDAYYIASAFIENSLPHQISTALAELDLNFPQISRVLKVGLKPLASLAKIKLANAELFESNTPGEKDEDEIEDIEDKDDTPDLFRNSTLGMYDIDMDSEDEFYDDEGPLDEMMSGSDMSEDESDNSGVSSDSELDSELEDEMMVDEIDEQLEGYDSDDDSANDIEIIDELDIHSGSNSESEGDLSDFHGFDEEIGEEFDEGDLGDDYYDELEEELDEEDYDDAELDEWLEAFGEEEEGDTGNADDRISRLHDRFSNGQDELSQLDYNSDVELNGATEDESVFESDGEDQGADHDHDERRTREFVTSFFNALRPIANSQTSSLFEGLVHVRNHNNTRRSFSLVDPRLGEGVLPRFDTAFEVILNDKHGYKSKTSFDNMLIRLTGERWEESYATFMQGYTPKILEPVREQILQRIMDDSFELFKQRVDEKTKARMEKEEKARARKEEQRRKREEEAQQRQLEQSSNPQPPRDPVMLWIGDREVDISGTDIDPEFFEALPEDMRQEVFTQHVRERRANASVNDSETREIDPDFLEALPDSIRDEILQLESVARRFSSSHFGYLDDEDNDEDEDEVADDFRLYVYHPEVAEPKEEKKPKKKTFAVPLIDRAGVAGLVRLLFAPKPVNQREHIYQTLLQVCSNRATRTDVMSMLIAVLYDGLVSQRSLEKLFGQVSARALNVKPHEINIASTFPLGSTPVIVGVQVIEAIYYLLERNNALRLYLLTEHENVFLSKKHQRKNKLKNPSKLEERYPINLLLNLLDNRLLSLEHIFIDLLANVLHFGTRPLLILRDKSKQHPAAFNLKFVPDRNMRLMIRILTSDECMNTTFRRTISAMQHLSLLQNAQKVFSLELSQKASELGTKIITDLKNLTSELEKGEDYDDSNKHIGKFTVASSAQSKLLRILTALDYMFETKKKKSEENQEKSKEIDELRGVYKHLQLGNLWDALSDCLRALEEHNNLNVATALLPMIEALMVVCKHSRVKELKIKDVMKYEAKRIDFTKEPIESLFFSFTDEHKKILNQMVRSNPNLMSGPFSMLVRNPKVLEFDNKRNYFDRQLHELKANNNKLTINVRRDQVFLDSYRLLFFKSVDEFRNSRLEVNFKGEAGIDAGGVTREWYQVLSRQMFNPDYALFTAVASDETTFHPNRTSYINPEHLSFFKFIGKIIGKAIFDGCFLDCHFSRAVYKKILDRPVSLKDMENLDLEYFKSLMWMLENDITDIITEDFSVETDDYGEHKIIDLIPDGRNIPVTEENKQEYVRLVVEYRLQTSVSEQMSNFIAGFHEIVPRDLIAIFDEQELELLISGMPDIDVTDWQNNTNYHNYSPSSEQIQWFWRAVKSFDNEERAKLLQFATGTSKVPLNGFKELRGANGGCKFNIHRDYMTTDRLPSSHTCFNQIDLPAYDNYETLRGSLLLAITEGHEGFGLA